MKKLLILAFLLSASLAFGQSPTQCLVAGVWVPCSSAPQPQFAQAALSNASSGSVASLAKAYGSNLTKGNTAVVVFANGNNNNPAAPITDTLSLTWFKAVQVNNSTAFETEIWYAPITTGGADTITVTPGGSNASIAMTIYEVSGLVYPAAGSSPTGPQALDQITSGTVTSGTSPALTLQPVLPNEYVFVGFGLGTAAQTITVASPYNNDSGQQNPTTPAGLFSFVSASLYKSGFEPTSPSATATSEPWAVAVATFRSIANPNLSTTQGMGTAGTPVGNVMSVQGVSGGTAQPVSCTAATCPTNVAQFGGSNAVTGTGASGAGIPRVTISNDSSLAANQSVNEAQINGVTPLMNNGASGTGSQRVNIANDNSAIANWGQGATGSAVPSGGHYIAGNGSGNLTGVTVCDNSAAINMSTSTTTQIIAISGTGGRTYICSINIIVGAADNVALISGSGTNCASNQAGLAGGTTAGSGWNFAANGGLTLGSGLGMVIKTATTNNEVCLVTSASAQVSGTITYTQF